MSYSTSLSIFLLALFLSACSHEEKKPPKPRSLSEVREIVLDKFRELDGFKLEKQLEVGVVGHPAVRMEGFWKQAGRKRRGIVYIVDFPTVFNVIHYTAPEDNGLFEAGYPGFQKVLKSIKPITWSGPLEVVEAKGEKVMHNGDLQLEIHYPSDWVYSLDEVNRAVVFSGPRNSPTWLTTVNFSVVNKWPVKK
jgi:hypothetical protein